MKHPHAMGLAATGYAAWALSLYLVAATSNLAFLVTSAAAAGVAVPATWRTLGDRGKGARALMERRLG